MAALLMGLRLKVCHEFLSSRLNTSVKLNRAYSALVTTRPSVNFSLLDSTVLGSITYMVLVDMALSLFLQRIGGTYRCSGRQGKVGPDFCFRWMSMHLWNGMERKEIVDYLQDGLNLIRRR